MLAVRGERTEISRTVPHVCMVHADMIGKLSRRRVHALAVGTRTHNIRSDELLVQDPVLRGQSGAQTAVDVMNSLAAHVFVARGALSILERLTGAGVPRSTVRLRCFPGQLGAHVVILSHMVALQHGEPVCHC